MNSDLEKKVRKNLEKFDQIETIEEDRIWLGINYHLDQHQNKIKNRIWLSAAAAIILLLASSVIYLSTEINNRKGVSEKQLLANIFPELQEDFNAYDEQIIARKAALSFDTINPDHFPDLFNEMKILNANYQSTLTDLESIGKDEAILRVLMRYHQRQLDLLERLSNEIEKNKLYNEKISRHFIY